MSGRTPLHDAVEEYLQKGYARFHMPGHKGTGSEALAWDITEVEGADSLYHAAGPILELEKQIAALYGAKRTLLSAGGATLCIQTMLALVCETGSKVVMSRNIHQAAIHTCALLDLSPVWIYPEQTDGWFLGRYSPTAVREALKAHPDAAAVYLTSPDYFGVISDLQGIAAVCREKDVPLLVDNAHGAHLKFLPQRYGQLHPMDCGAAICCDSLHKTMPAMTGAALLHLGEQRFCQDAKRRMALFGSTSPSYPILLSCERAAAYAESQEAQAGFDETARRLDRLRLLALQKGFALPQGVSDPAKLVLGFAARGFSAQELKAKLHASGIEPEYVSNTACVLMANGLNTAEDYQRVERFLLDLDAGMRVCAPMQRLAKLEQACSVRQAVFAQQQPVALEQALGRVAADASCPCPPGVPVVMPGERINEQAMVLLKDYGITQLQVISNKKTVEI